MMGSAENFASVLATQQSVLAAAERRRQRKEMLAKERQDRGETNNANNNGNEESKATRSPSSSAASSANRRVSAGGIRDSNAQVDQDEDNSASTATAPNSAAMAAAPIPPVVEAGPVDPRVIFHEKQTLLRCGLHTVNNLFGGSIYTLSSFDSVISELDADNFGLSFRHQLPFHIGNYDANVLMSALEKGGYRMQWLDKRKPVESFRIGQQRHNFIPPPVSDDSTHPFLNLRRARFCGCDDVICGFIINVNTNYLFGLYHTQHWYAVRRVNQHWINADSKLSVPEKIEDIRAFIKEKAAQPDTHVFIVKNPGHEEEAPYLETEESKSGNGNSNAHSSKPPVVERLRSSGPKSGTPRIAAIETPAPISNSFESLATSNAAPPTTTYFFPKSNNIISPSISAPSASAPNSSSLAAAAPTSAAHNPLTPPAPLDSSSVNANSAAQHAPAVTAVASADDASESTPSVSSDLVSTTATEAAPSSTASSSLSSAASP